MHPKRRRDPGLQPERTSLSWYRTTFVCLINSLLLLRNAAMRGSRLFWITGFIMLVLALLMYLYSYLHSSSIQTTKELSSEGDIWFKRILSVIVTLYALLLSLYFFITAVFS